MAVTQSTVASPAILNALSDRVNILGYLTSIAASAEVSLSLSPTLISILTYFLVK
jgi:hypothetical protein